MTNILVSGEDVSVVVLYNANSYAAERSPEVINMVPILLRDLQITGRITLHYLEIVSNPTIDYAHLYKQFSFGTSIFISAFNSNECLYLKTLFFDSNPRAVHLNSYSTSTEFNTNASLIRVLPPDNLIAQLYDKISSDNNYDTIIVYDSSSSWSLGLKNDIMDQLIPTMTIDTFNNIGWETTLLSFAGSNATIILLVDDNMLQVLEIIQALNLSYTFRFLFGDASNQYVFPTIASWLQQHQTLLLEAFISQEELDYATILNIELNNPAHPASDLIVKYRCKAKALRRISHNPRDCVKCDHCSTWHCYMQRRSVHMLACLYH